MRIRVADSSWEIYKSPHISPLFSCGTLGRLCNLLNLNFFTWTMEETNPTQRTVKSPRWDGCSLRKKSAPPSAPNFQTSAFCSPSSSRGYIPLLSLHHSTPEQKGPWQFLLSNFPSLPSPSVCHPTPQFGFPFPTDLRGGTCSWGLVATEPQPHHR